MYDLIFTDLDGTLLLENGKIGSYTTDVLKALSNNNKQVVFATGRSYYDIKSMIDDINIPVHTITSNGSRVISSCGQLNETMNLPEDVVRTLIDESKKSDLIINMYCGSQWLTTQKDHDLSDFNQSEHFLPRFVEVDQLPVQNVEKVFFIHPQRLISPLLELQAKLDGMLAKKINLTFSFNWCLEVMDNNVSKGEAVKKLAGFLDIPLDNCIGFGDGMNDLEMLSTVGKGLVMSNSSPTLKSSLPGCNDIGCNKSESVAKYLSSLL